MRNKVTLRVIMATSCFIFAGVKLAELLRGPGNYQTTDLLILFLFFALGLFYVYLLLRDRKSSDS